MGKVIVILWVVFVCVYAEVSPISGYERVISSNGKVEYLHTKSDFNLTIRKVIDSENYYNGGEANTYDDPYIRTLLQNQKVLQRFGKANQRVIQIVFLDRKQQIAYLKKYGIALFEEQNLTIELIELDKHKLSHPLRLSVYPFFVVGSRYVQGYIDAKHLKELLEEEATYYKEYAPTTIKSLSKRLAKKYIQTKNLIKLTYNKKSNLFEVRQVNQKKVLSYISAEGRYILIP